MSHTSLFRSSPYGLFSSFQGLTLIEFVENLLTQENDYFTTQSHAGGNHDLPFIAAIRQNCPLIVCSVLLHIYPGVVSLTIDNNKESAAHISARLGRVDVMRLLLGVPPSLEREGSVRRDKILEEVNALEEKHLLISSISVECDIIPWHSPQPTEASLSFPTIICPNKGIALHEAIKHYQTQVALTLVQYELDHGRSDQSQFDKSVIMAIDQFEDTELNCRLLLLILQASPNSAFATHTPIADEKNADSLTALCRAIRQNKPHFARVIFDFAPQCATVMDKRWNSLHLLALQMKSIDKISCHARIPRLHCENSESKTQDELLLSTIYLNPSSYGHSPFEIAKENEFFLLIADIIKAFPELVSTPSRFGNIIHHYLAYRGYKGLLEDVTSLYPDGLRKQGDFGDTTLHFAIKGKKFDVAWWILERFPDAPKVCNSMNHYPLHYLARLDNSPDDFIATILDNTPQEGIKRLRLDNSEMWARFCYRQMTAFLHAATLASGTIIPIDLESVAETSELNANLSSKTCEEADSINRRSLPPPPSEMLSVVLRFLWGKEIGIIKDEQKKRS